MPDDTRRALYDRYVSTHTRRDPGTRHIVSHPLLRDLPDDPRSVLLDIGCGDGEFVARAEQLGYLDVSGVDISPEQVALAHRLGRTTVVQADVWDYLAERPATYDAITASDVFEHFDRDEVISLLRRIHDSLVPGGVLLAQVPNAVSPFFGNYAYGDFTHRSVFTSRSAHQVLASTGFEEIRARELPPVAHGAKSAARRVAWAPISGCMKLALAVETGLLRGHLVTQNIALAARKPS